MNTTQLTALQALAKPREAAYVTARALGVSAATLNALVKQGLVSREDMHDTDMTVKGHYAITAAGQAELDSALFTIDTDGTQYVVSAPAGHVWSNTYTTAVTFWADYYDTTAELNAAVKELTDSGFEQVTENNISRMASDTLEAVQESLGADGSILIADEYKRRGHSALQAMRLYKERGNSVEAGLCESRAESYFVSMIITRAYALGRRTELTETEQDRKRARSIVNFPDWSK